MKIWKKGAILGVMWTPISYIVMFIILMDRVEPINFFDKILLYTISLPIMIVQYIRSIPCRNVPYLCQSYFTKLFGSSGVSDFVFLILLISTGALIGAIIGYLIDKYKK